MRHQISHSTLFGLSPNPYMVLDLDFTIVEANEAYLAVTGRRREEILGRHLFDAFPGNPDDPDDCSEAQLRHSLEHVRKSQQPHHLALIRYAIAHSTPRGLVFEERFWSATHVPVCDEKGDLISILQHTVDVTELQSLKKAMRAFDHARVEALELGVFERARAVQAAHETLDAQHRHLRALFEQAPGFVAVLRGPLHVFDLVNQSYYQLVGHRDIVGQTVREALPEVEGQGYFELLDQVYATAEAFVGRGMKVAVQWLPEAPLEERYVDVVYQPILEADGSVSGVFVQGHDVTEQHQARQEMERYRAQLESLLQERTEALAHSEAQHALTQAQLQHAQRLEALGQLTGGVAHDFNNLLQVLGSSLQLIQRVTAGNAQAERWIGTARNAVNSGAKLTGQLLAFARRQPLEPQIIHVGRLVAGMEDLLRRALGGVIELETGAAAGLWNTLVDPAQLENAILNLAINARDAMGQQGKLTIRASNATLQQHDLVALPDMVPGDYVLLAVSDNGAGMAPDVLGRVFEPFFTTKPEGVGTGLGLSMVYGFVRQSGGHVKLDSERGRGTTVRVYLPRSLLEEARADITVTGPVKGGTERILVVEDDPEVLRTSVEILSELGYQVRQATDGQSALALLKSGEQVDLLFTDVVMPGPVRSPDLARQAQALLPGLPVLFTSGYTQDAIMHEGRLDPGVHLISKPYHRDDLARKLRQLLPATVAAREQPAAGPHGHGPVRILFVEDDDDLRMMGAAQIAELGYEVQDVPTAEAALAVLAQQPVDVLVTDIGLPGQPGDAMALEARRLWPHLKVVLASGYGRSFRPSGDAAIEGALVLAKPYTEEGLEQVLTEITRDL